MEPENTTEQDSQKPQSNEINKPTEKPKKTKKKLFVILVAVLLILFILTILSAYFYSKKSNNNLTLNTQQNDSIYNTPSTENEFNEIILQGKNKLEVGEWGEKIIYSPDGKYVAKYYYEGPERYQGDPAQNFVDILSTETNQTTTFKLNTHDRKYPLSDTYYPMYWSPVDNRIYFTDGDHGTGTHSLWSSNPDGSDQKFVAGLNWNDKSHNHQTASESAIYKAKSIDFSLDGKKIITVREIDTPKNYRNEIWLMDYDGSNSRPVPNLNNYKNIDSAKWKNDGIHFEFTTLDGKTKNTYLADIDGLTFEMISSEIIEK